MNQALLNQVEVVEEQNAYFRTRFAQQAKDQSESTAVTQSVGEVAIARSQAERRECHVGKENDFQSSNRRRREDIVEFTPMKAGFSRLQFLDEI
jgi:hypothetical protein